MARAGASAARIGRTPPAVTLAGGTVGTSTLLTDGSTDAVAIPVSPARAGDDALDARFVDRAAMAALPLVDGLLDALTEWDALPRA